MRCFIFIVSLALFVACSRKATNDASLEASSLVSPAPKMVEEGEVQRRQDGLLYHVPTSAPYTGTVNMVLADGRKALVRFKEGVQHGEQHEWYPNGNLAAVTIFKNGLPVGMRKEWDESGDTEFEITIKDGQPMERKVVSNASLTLSEKERKYLWDTEHHGSLLRKFGFKPLIQSLELRDSNLIAKHLHSEFEALVPKGKAQVVRSIGSVGKAVRWDVEEGNREQLGREAFLGWIGQLLDGFHKDPKVKISLMQFAPVKRYSLEGLWRGNIQLKLFGETADGEPRELVLYVDIEVNKPDEAGLTEGHWLMAAEIARMKESNSDHYLMKDVAVEMGVNIEEMSDNWKVDPEKAASNTGGVFVCDFNHDGVEDFIVSDLKLPQGFKLYRGRARGDFEDVTTRVGLDANRAHIFVWVDIDGDNWEDLLLNSGQVYRNVEGEKFEEMSGKSNLKEVGDLVKTGSFTYHAIADYDGDGLLDIYLFRADSQPLKGTWIDGKVGHNAKNQLLRNKGNWQFEDVTAATGTDGGARSTFSSVWFDANNDQRPDLYVIHEYGNGLLLVNQPDGTFKSQELADRAADFGSMGLASGDFNNDGRIDLYVASMYSKSGSRVIGNLKLNAYNEEVMSKLKRMVAGSQLYQNNGDLQFQPVGKQYDVIGIGWAYAPTLADLDNDGFLDIHATTGFISRTRDKPDG